MIRSPLLFAEHVLPAPTPIREWAHFWDWADSHRAPMGDPRVPRPTGHNPSKVAVARIDEGRWIADCPWRCGASFNLPQKATWFWCTECAGGGFGLTAALAWPDDIDRLTANMESLPSMMQRWPCLACTLRLGAARLCDSCRHMQGQEV